MGIHSILPKNNIEEPKRFTKLLLLLSHSQTYRLLAILFRSHRTPPLCFAFREWNRIKSEESGLDRHARDLPQTRLCNKNPNSRLSGAALSESGILASDSVGESANPCQSSFLERAYRQSSGADRSDSIFDTERVNSFLRGLLAILFPPLPCLSLTIRGEAIFQTPRMRDQYDDEYYDDEEGYIDEYEEEGDEEQEEVREPPKPTKEEKEFLSRRERLKEMYRQKMLKERASTFGRTAVHETPKNPSQDKFGSFFGPSLPGIAQRVIEETKSMKENGYLYSSSKSTASSTSKGAAQMSSRPKSSNGQQSHGSKKVNEVKKKVEILKGNRDYSFLFSDDADEPNGPSAKNSSQLKSDPSTSHPSSAKHVKEPSRGHPTGPNSSRSASSTAGPSTQRYSQQHNRPGSTAQRYQQQLNQRPGTSRQPQPPSNRPRPISNGSHHPSPSTGPKAPGTAKAANKAPMKTVNGSSNHQSVVRRTTSVAPNPRPHVSSSMQRHPTEEKRAGPVSARPGIKSGPPSKSQPFKQISSAGSGRAREHVRPIASNGNGRVREHDRVREHESRNVTVKKKPVAKRPFDDEDDDNAIDMIRKMFNYNPNRWAGRDEDDSDMEVGFDTIMKEERISSQIAKKEDEEQLRLIEEEERRERERMRKKQKLRHG